MLVDHGINALLGLAEFQVVPGRASNGASAGAGGLLTISCMSRLKNSSGAQMRSFVPQGRYCLVQY